MREKIPDHSTFSKTRIRKWNESNLFRQAFTEIVHQCITAVLVDGKEMVADVSYIPAQVSKSSWIEVSIGKLALDRGYDTGAVHRGLELPGITGYIPAIDIPNAPLKYGFQYNAQEDAFLCPMGKPLTYHRLNCNKSTGKYLRCYQIRDDSCVHCSRKPEYFDKAGIRRRALGSSCYPAFHLICIGLEPKENGESPPFYSEILNPLDFLFDFERFFSSLSTGPTLWGI